VEKFLKPFDMRFPSYLFAALFFTVAATTSACPDCSIKNNTTMVEQGSTTAKLALSDNVLLMIVIVMSVLAFMIWMMVKTCRELAAQRDLQPGVSRS
jgi:heme/copper-type cytochrome/quinol oxidase subunit 2